MKCDAQHSKPTKPRNQDGKEESVDEIIKENLKILDDSLAKIMNLQ